MTNLLSVGVCPYCDNGHKTGCFAEYVDGYKCYSCGIARSFDNHRMAILGRTRATIKKDVHIPKYSRRVSEWPASVLKELYKHYIFEDAIYKYGIGYIEDRNRLLFPVIEDNEIVFAQTREYPIKRINSEGDKRLFKIETGSKKVVIVEDYQSCIRVGEFCDAICLFGTYIAHTEVKSILDKYNDISLWLDNDKGGWDGVKKITAQLTKQMCENKLRFPLRYLQTYSIVNIESDNDPKTYSSKEIERRIYNVE